VAITSIDLIINAFIKQGNLQFDAHWWLNNTYCHRLVADKGTTGGFYEGWLFALASTLNRLNDVIEADKKNECVVQIHLIGDPDNTFAQGIATVAYKLCEIVVDELPPKPLSFVIERAVWKKFNYKKEMRGFDERVCVVTELVNLKDKFALLALTCDLIPPTSDIYRQMKQEALEARSSY